jgi:hypothetical protein
MQPLSSVKSDAAMRWGQASAMTERPKVAAKIAQFITDCSEIDAIMGAMLAYLLRTDEAVAVAMYSAVESRTAQIRLGSVLNKDSRVARVVIQGLRMGGGLDSEATFLAERRGMGPG